MADKIVIPNHQAIPSTVTERLAVHLGGRHHIAKSFCPIAVFEVNGIQMSATWFHKNKKRERKIVVRYPWPSSYLGKDKFGEPIWSAQEGFAIDCSDLRQMTNNPAVGNWIERKSKEIKERAKYMTSKDRDVAGISFDPKQCKCGEVFSVQFLPNVIEGTGHMFVKWVCTTCGNKQDMKKEEFDLLKGNQNGQ